MMRSTISWGTSGVIGPPCSFSFMVEVSSSIVEGYEFMEWGTGLGYMTVQREGRNSSGVQLIFLRTIEKTRRRRGLE